jgi:CheY-like chemotaxis protein
MIENDPDDRYLTEEVFRLNGFDPEIDFVYSTDLHAYISDPGNKPQLILLNLNAQLHEGADCIKYIRNTEGYQLTPLVVLSESARPADVQKCYSLGASSFIKKPDDYSGTLFKIKAFVDYWFQAVELPVPEEQYNE